MWQIKVIDLKTQMVFTRVSDEVELYKAEWDVLQRLYKVRPSGNFSVLSFKEL